MQGVREWLECLDAAIEGTGVDEVDGRRDLLQVLGELLGLGYTIRRQGWVGDDAGG
jgi:hypothetical protein